MHQSSLFQSQPFLVVIDGFRKKIWLDREDHQNDLPILHAIPSTLKNHLCQQSVYIEIVVHAHLGNNHLEVERARLS